MRGSFSACESSAGQKVGGVGMRNPQPELSMGKVEGGGRNGTVVGK